MKAFPFGLNPGFGLVLISCLLSISGCQASPNKDAEGGGASGGDAKAAYDVTVNDTADFAGGCFWCMEPPFEKLTGVQEAVSGYTGGQMVDPTYDEVSYGKTDHVEAVRVLFDSTLVSYERLLQSFWMSINPTDTGGQFADRGPHYRPGIYYRDEAQKKSAMESKQKLSGSNKFDEPIIVPILKAGTFYRAEEYHQDYYQKNPDAYKRYYRGSGRGPFVETHWESGGKPTPADIWGESYTAAPGSANSAAWKNFAKPSEQVLRERLTPLQFKVTQEDGTEPAFSNEFWDNKKPGIYVDIVSGEPLFSSAHKFKSGTGWPSFTQPLESSNVVERTDRTYGMVRTEVRSKHADSHLGHVFEDGPPPTGLRYCLNSAALRFIPAEQLAEKGYGEYAGLLAEELSSK